MDSRPLLTSMDDDYASYALSQRRSFEHAFPAILEAALALDAEPVLRVMDQGAADGLNSHLLIEVLIAMRAGRPLVYSFVDMPTNAWAVAARHLRQRPALSGSAGGAVVRSVAVVPSSDSPRARDLGTGPHVDSAADHAAEVDAALAGGATTVIGMAGIPLHSAPSYADGQVHLAITGTTMHWVEAPTDLGSTGSVFPGYAGHADHAQRAAWREQAARQWEQLVRMRSRELAPGGWFVAALPASDTGDPDRAGLYDQIVSDMNAVLAEWVAAGIIAQATADAVVTPVWMRTPAEIRAPFDAAGGAVDGLALERVELFRLDNPYWHEDPRVFAQGFVQSCVAWGGPLFLRAFAREGDDRAQALLDDFVAALEDRVAGDPARHRWDYIEALVVARKSAG